MSEKEQISGEEKRRPPSGPVSSPRAYFGRASRVATGVPRAGIGEEYAAGPTEAPKQPPIYRAGDPALRLFSGFTLPLPPTALLTGAIASLSGIKDGEHEKLFIDLGSSLVRATRQRDEKAGTLSLILSRTQNAATYAGVLASLRYVNDAPAPTSGMRQIVLQIVDAAGRAKHMATAAFGVGAVQPERKPETSLITGGERVVLGETLSFNTEGDYTLFWWPNRLPSAAERPRRAAAPPASETDAGSFFSAGGKVYRLFDAAAERASAPPPVAAQRVVSESVRVAPPIDTPARAANDSVSPNPGAANDPVRVVGHNVSGFERVRPLRLEDIFGSDMQDPSARALIDLRIASSG